MLITRGAGATLPQDDEQTVTTEEGNVKFVVSGVVTTTWHTLSTPTLLPVMQKPLGNVAESPCAALVVTVTVPLVTAMLLMATASGLAAIAGSAPSMMSQSKNLRINLLSMGLRP